MTRSLSYQDRLVLLLSLAWAMVSFETYGINYIIPFVQPALRLSNTQVGALTSGFWVTYALSTFLAGEVAERIGGRTRLLFLTLGIFSIASLSSGFATSFATLFAARLLVGFLAGPILPLTFSILALESSPARRSLNMGIVQGVAGNVLSGFVAPIALVYVASISTWRNAFFLICLPCLVCSYLVSRTIHEPLAEKAASHDADLSGPRGGGWGEVLRSRNIWLCMFAGSLIIGYSALGYGFMPLFQVKIRHFSVGQMSALMGLLGLAAVLYCIIVPALSERIGRRMTIFTGCLLAALSPLALIYGPDSVVLIGTLMFVSWVGPATFPLLSGTIPSESVSSGAMPKAIGAIIGVGTIAGGVGGPFFAGRSADQYGLAAPLFLMLAFALGAAACGLALQETLPKRALVRSSPQ